MAELAATEPTLRDLHEAGRLVWYNLGTGGDPRPDAPIVPVRYFSGEAALGLLATAGVRNVRSLGIDGGTSYSATFTDLDDKTLLANGRSSFDRQFEEFPKIIMRTGVDYAPLDAETPIRVYVAATESEMLPVKVLEYSIRTHASVTTRVIPLHTTGIAIPTPRDPRNHARTPFSFQRFLIPEATGHSGHAIYLDADMQLFRDIRHLWQTAMGEADILAVREPQATGRKPQFSVMLLDCAKLGWSIDRIVADLDAGAYTYEALMHEMAAGGKVARVLDEGWNSLERYAGERTALVHYTDMETQPWVHATNPIGYLWTRELLRAIADGAIDRGLVAEHVARGWVRPSLLTQIDEGINDGILLGRRARSIDRGFVAPYRALNAVGARPWLSPAMQVRATLRDLYHRSPLWRLERKIRGRLSR
ncbi:MAG: hypothetical protein H0X45_05370 [Planctomycetes bacterium]|nr:hypothetical protein [Planctomycetota bacterium]